MNPFRVLLAILVTLIPVQLTGAAAMKPITFQAFVVEKPFEVQPHRLLGVDKRRRDPYPKPHKRHRDTRQQAHKHR